MSAPFSFRRGCRSVVYCNIPDVNRRWPVIPRSPSASHVHSEQRGICSHWCGLRGIDLGTGSATGDLLRYSERARDRILRGACPERTRQLEAMEQIPRSTRDDKEGRGLRMTREDRAARRDLRASPSGGFPPGATLRGPCPGGSV